ncbi:hypothetical protein ACE7GA_16515 [Roseomonas sp. CCTCC AB2023176]|uniref:hypothetical protein n=1 Tax=Roseomonas sp. CCTCC AB2023176 TaxID=3342640 RepID=UPI0035DF6D9D
MPYEPQNLIPLVAADNFSMWLYRTTDTRAVVLAPGYFATATNRLRPGHIVVVQAGDATSILPVREGGGVGNGLVVDASSPALRLTAAGLLDFDAALTATAVARCLTLGPVPAGLNVGEAFAIGATVTGPVATVRFTLLDAAGNVAAGPNDVAVAGGAATTTFTAPAAANGYRLRAADAAEPLVTQTSPSFVVLSAFALLLETGAGLLLENGARLAL